MTTPESIDTNLKNYSDIALLTYALRDGDAAQTKRELFENALAFSVEAAPASSLDTSTKALNLLARKTVRQQLSHSCKYLTEAFKHGIFESKEPQLVEVSKRLISEAREKNSQEPQGPRLTDIALAAADGNTPRLQWLLENTPIPQFPCMEETPLFQAIRNGHEETALYILHHTLLSPLMDMQAVDTDNGSSLLHWAAFQNMTRVCHVLIERGLDPSSANFYGLTPLAYAMNNSEEAVVQMLEQDATLAGERLDQPIFDEDVQLSYLQLAAKNGYKKAVDILLKEGCHRYP